MRRGVGLSAVLSVATATSGFLIMSAILNYSSAGDAIVCEALNLKKQVERLYSRDLEEGFMAKPACQSKTRIRLNVAKVKRAQKALGVKTETAAIEQALDLVIAESERNRLAFEANERFIKSGVEIKDVYGKLDR